LITDETSKLTLIQVAAGRSLDFIAVFSPSRRADSSGEAFAANKIPEVLICLIDDEPEAMMVLLIANILRNLSRVQCCSGEIPSTLYRLLSSDVSEKMSSIS